MFGNQYPWWTTHGKNRVFCRFVSDLSDSGLTWANYTRVIHPVNAFILLVYCDRSAP